MKFKNTIYLLFIALIGSMTLNAQELKFPDLDKSPMDAVHYPRTSAFNNYMDEDDKKDRQIKVLYCRPYKKGRDIFGGLEEYGKDWRLGANEATEVTFYNDVEIGGKFVRRGTYTMFAELHPEHWIIKVSTERNIAGTANRDVSKDVVSVKVPVVKMPEVREQFTIGFQRINEESCNMVFEWDKTRTVLPISFNPIYLAGEDKSPMDLAQYPRNSRIRNHLKEEELAEATPKVRVIYSRPQKNDRDIFGGLKEFGDTWRMGANETSEITFYQDVTIGGQDVKRGTYGMMAVVNKDKWDITLHTNIPSWGHANHDEETNVCTFSVPTASTPSVVEALAIIFEKKDATNVDMIVAWDRTMVRVPIVIKK